MRGKAPVLPDCIMFSDCTGTKMFPNGQPSGHVSCALLQQTPCLGSVPCLYLKPTLDQYPGCNTEQVAWPGGIGACQGEATGVASASVRGAPALVPAPRCVSSRIQGPWRSALRLGEAGVPRCQGLPPVHPRKYNREGPGGAVGEETASASGSDSRTFELWKRVAGWRSRRGRESLG